MGLYLLILLRLCSFAVVNDVVSGVDVCFSASRTWIILVVRVCAMMPIALNALDIKVLAIHLEIGNVVGEYISTKPSVSTMTSNISQHVIYSR